MDKADVLEKLLKYIADNEDTPRILIFSDYPETFEKIIKNISRAGLQYDKIAGIPSHISNVINNFNSGKINILLMDSKHYGMGMNLQQANYIITYHRMLTELETQVIGRAQRYGRKDRLKIIYLINESESSQSPMTKNPMFITDSDELWMITNPPDAIEEEFNESDEDTEKSDKNNDIQDVSLEEPIDTDGKEIDKQKKKGKKSCAKEEADKPAKKRTKKHSKTDKKADKKRGKKGDKKGDKKSGKKHKEMKKVRRIIPDSSDSDSDDISHDIPVTRNKHKKHSRKEY